MIYLIFFSCNLCSVTSITVGTAAALTTLSLCQQLHCLTGEINLVVSRFIRAFYITVDYSNSAGWLVGVLNTYLVCGQARESKSKYVKF